MPVPEPANTATLPGRPPVPEQADGTAESPSITAEAIFPAACAYYVAPDGSDDAPGSEAQPWATFQHAADTTQPGDTICFRGGVYPVEETHLTSSGTATALIAFVALSLIHISEPTRPY